jgi:hypothetical protein
VDRKTATMRICHEEAGHAVAALSSPGVVLIEVSTVPSRLRGGWCEIRGGTDRQRGVIYCAGPIAQWRYCGAGFAADGRTAGDFWGLQDGGDVELLGASLTKLSGETAGTRRAALRDELGADAKRLVDANWSAITRLANELYDELEMTGEQVKRFLGWR